MQRPVWKGFITFGLVNIPIILFSAENKFDIQFKLVDSRDKARIRYVRINEHTGREVPWEEVAKGYEYDDHDFVLVRDDEIKKIAGELTKTIDIEAFVNKDDVNSMMFDKAYYVVPDKKGDKGYVILREVLNTTNKVGIAKVIIHTRQYLAALMCYDDALILNLLHYDQEIRKPEEYDLPAGSLKTYKVTAKEIEIAKQLVSSMTTKWKPENYQDDFRHALEKMIEDKIHHQKPTKLKRKGPAIAKKSNVINFVDLLKKSLAEKKVDTKKPHKSKKKSRHKTRSAS